MCRSINQRFRHQHHQPPAATSQLAQRNNTQPPATTIAIELHPHSCNVGKKWRNFCSTVFENKEALQDTKHTTNLIHFIGSTEKYSMYAAKKEETMSTPVPSTLATAKISRKRSLQSIHYAPGAATASKRVDVKKPIRIVSSLPDRLSEMKNPKNNKAPSESPHAFLMKCLSEMGVKTSVQRFDVVNSLFEEPKKNEIDAYGFEALDAVRQRNIEKLKEFHKQGRPLKCSNRFGESILHLACRKGFADVVEFLVKEAEVPVWVKDDFGRSPLSDACWTVKPNFELMDILIEKAPDLLLVSDARGHTPLAYVRREHWEIWTKYLKSKSEDLKPTKLEL